MSKLAKALQSAAGNAGGAEDLAAAIDFDGTNDYLSRSSDLTGNADGKTFTFSAWIYETSGNSKIYHIDNGSGSTRFQIAFDGTGASSKLEITGTNASGTTVLNIDSLAGNLALNTWQHILVSIDLTNSSNRHIYINGVSQTVTWNTYSNDNIDFTSASYLSVGAALYSGPNLRLPESLRMVYVLTPPSPVRPLPFMKCTAPPVVVPGRGPLSRYE